jgi:uncharacterized protein YegL
MTTENIFTELFLKFQDKSIDLELVPIPNVGDVKFGILNLKASSVSLNEEQEYDFIFMIDCSGSMSDRCADGRDKMQHIVHTLKNMITYFKENPGIKTHITIYAFDSKIYKIIERTRITDENFHLIIANVGSISPRDSTNIELALKTVLKTVEKIKSENPLHNIINIFMTDGQSTDGKADHAYLSTLVDDSVTNAFIGFGIDHDAGLLNAVSEGENSAYHFIDKLENSGLVYGEILHGIVYKLLKQVEIHVENGLIYDFKNNCWTNTLFIGEIVSESSKFYHVASETPEECFIEIQGKKCCETDSDFHLNINATDRCDLANFIFRQRTLQLLFEVKDFLKRKNTNEITDAIFLTYRTSVNSNQIREEENRIRKKLSDFIEEMKEYMEDNSLTQDKFMKNLCDDIYICYRTFGTKFGNMFVSARQTSQGTQRCYTVTNTQTDDLYDRFPLPPVLRRHNNPLYFNNISSDNMGMMNHEVSTFDDAPYLTPTATRMMREISSQPTHDEEEDQETQSP